LFAEGYKPVEIIHWIHAQYSDNWLLHSKIYEWIDHFEKRITVCDEERSGKQSTVLKPLKEWCGKTNVSQWMTLQRLSFVLPSERSSKRKIQWRSH